jgi:hypothetical protein
MLKQMLAVVAILPTPQAAAWGADPTMTADQAALAFIDKERALFDLLPVPPNGDATFPLKMQKSLIEIDAMMVMGDVDNAQFIKEQEGQYQYSCDKTKPNWRNIPCRETFAWTIEGKSYFKRIDHATNIVEYCTTYKKDAMALCLKVPPNTKAHYVWIKNTKTGHYAQWEYTPDSKAQAQ